MESIRNYLIRNEKNGRDDTRVYYLYKYLIVRHQENATEQNVTKHQKLQFFSLLYVKGFRANEHQ